MQLLKSIGLFWLGVFKRFYWVAPSILALALNFSEFIKKYFDMNYILPQWLLWVFFVSSLFVAIILTYHELRMQKINLVHTSSKDKLNAISQIKSIADNIPPDLDIKELIKKLNAEPDFCKNLTQRMVRLFGLRNELILYIETSIVEFIDTQLKPLYIIQTGTYTFKKEKLYKFAQHIVQLRLMVDLEEKRLLKKINEG